MIYRIVEEANSIADYSAYFDIRY